ncbi:hypothetical protein KI387_043353, partial [Taxus chinensis]
ATSLQKASTSASSSSSRIALESMSSMASTMRFAAQIHLDPALSGDLNLHKDEEGIESVKVTLKNDDFKSRSVDKKMLNDPAFMPRIRSDNPFFPGNEKRAEMNPKQLRFTQPNIVPNFKNPTLPSVEDAATLMRQRRLDPAVFGELTVHKDKEGVVWCEKNCSLYALRAAGVPSVK